MTGMYSKAKFLTWIVRAVQQQTSAAQDCMSKNVQEDLLYCRVTILLMPQTSCQLEIVQPQCYTKVRISYSFLLDFLVGGGYP